MVFHDPQAYRPSFLAEVQEFLLRFDLGPPEGFHDLPEPEEVTATTGAPGQSTAEVPLGREPYGLGVQWGGVGQGNVVNEILVRS